jgi:hypothetical protein
LKKKKEKMDDLFENLENYYKNCENDDSSSNVCIFEVLENSVLKECIFRKEIFMKN